MDNPMDDEPTPSTSRQHNDEEDAAELRSSRLSSESTSSVDFSRFKSPTPSESSPPPPPPPEKLELVLANELIEVPSKLFRDEEFFRSVVTKEAFYSLSEGARSRLIKHLPPEMAANMDDALDFILSKEKSTGFLPPLTTVYNRFEGKRSIAATFIASIPAGYYSPAHAADSTQLRDFHKVLYYHFIRNHNMQLLRKLVLNRHQILENASTAGPTEPIVPKIRQSKRKFLQEKKLRKRSSKRVALMLAHTREVVGAPDDRSSDESGTEDTKVPLPISESDRESTLFNPKVGRSDLDLHQPMELPSAQQLLRQYKKLREVNPECPSLDLNGIVLEEAYERAGLSFVAEKNFARQRLRQLLDEPGGSQTISTPASQSAKAESPMVDVEQL
ncbi:hypothetical protein M3Y99_01769200 [Aphelenchoides fujianensis]|nr:hypothetical protein M3Y99_01769200 [Aphelenchoides fujianensis]